MPEAAVALSDSFLIPPNVAEAKAVLRQSFPRGAIRRVLFFNPPDGETELFRFDTAKRRRYPNYPPYGPALLATQLRELGIEVEIVNLNHEILRAVHEADDEASFDYDQVWQDRSREATERFQPDLIGVTCMFTMTHVSLRRLCEFLAPCGTPIAIGGVHVTNDVERVLDDIPSVRFAFLQEAELALQAFVEAVSGQGKIEALGQVIMNHKGERYRFARSCRPGPEQINFIPAYDLIQVGDLTRFGVIGNFHGFKPPTARFATVLSNRGCRAQCTFCSVRNFNGKAVRQRDVENVLDELQLLHERYGIEHITWLDDDLLKDHKRAIALFDGMVQRQIKMTWDASNGVIASSCTEDVVHAMAESGCIALNIGMESGNPKILREVKKPGTVKTFVEAARVLRQYEQIHARIFLMLGFPGETLSQISDTINVAREMDLDWCGITVLQPLPNTPIYDAMVEQGLIDKVGNRETRFNSGGYGKQDQVDMGLRLASMKFEEAFCSIPMHEVPTREQLDDIWFFMNYHLNFHRLFTEERPGKMRQQLMNLRALSDVISPEHGFALYFTGYLQYKLNGATDSKLIARLEQRLSGSAYWNDRFSAFGLLVDDLRDGNFANKEIPRLVPGELPRDSAELVVSF